MHQFLTLVEVAERLGLPAREVRDLLGRHGIQGRLVQGVEQYRRNDVVGLLERILKDLPGERLSHIDGAIQDQPAGTGEAGNLLVTRLLERGRITCCLHANTRPSALRKLASLAVSTGRIFDEQLLLALLEEREELESTALDNGVAIPHPRSPHSLYVEDDVLVLARTAHPIPFGARKGVLSWLFVMAVTTDPDRHLRLLARLSRLFRSHALTESLREVVCDEEILSAVRSAELALT